MIILLSIVRRNLFVTLRRDIIVVTIISSRSRGNTGDTIPRAAAVPKDGGVHTTSRLTVSITHARSRHF